MTMILTHVTTGAALSEAIAETSREDKASSALAWIGSQLRFERLLRALEEETPRASANRSSDA